MIEQGGHGDFSYMEVFSSDKIIETHSAEAMHGWMRRLKAGEQKWFVQMDLELSIMGAVADSMSTGEGMPKETQEVSWKWWPIVSITRVPPECPERNYKLPWGS